MWPGREAEHAFPSSAEVKVAALYLQSPTHPHGTVLNQLSTRTTLPSLLILFPPASPALNYYFLFHACACVITTFTADFLVISRRISLVSSDYVNLTGVLQWLRLALSKGSNWVRVFSSPSPEDGNRSSFRNDVFLLRKSPDDGKSPKTPVILCAIHHRQNPLKSILFLVHLLYSFPSPLYCSLLLGIFCFLISFSVSFAIYSSHSPSWCPPTSMSFQHTFFFLCRDQAATSSTTTASAVVAVQYGYEIKLLRRALDKCDTESRGYVIPENYIRPDQTRQWPT
jgi:hypothetical protein